MRYSFIKSAVRLFLFFFGVVALHAQEGQFLTEVPLSQANFTQTEQARWNHFFQSSSTQSIRLVQLGTLPNLISNGQLTFSIPGGAQNLQAEGGYIKEESNGDYVWWANLSNETGYVGVAKNSAGKLACIQKDSQIYQVHPLSNRYNALVETRRDTSLETDCSPTPFLPPDITTDPNNCDPIDDDCKAVVSVLVLVTPEAEGFLTFDWSGLYLQLGLHTINFALVNSGVFGKSVRFIIEPYNFEYSGEPFIEEDLEDLLNDSDAQDRRFANNADLMILLTDDRYVDASGALKYFFSILPFFGIVTVGSLGLPRFTFAHELGHAFLLNHNRESNLGDVDYEGTNWCNFGWPFFDQESIERRTVMAVLYKSDEQQGESRILNFSNPDVPYNGAPTGNSLNANAQRVSRTMCEVDDYFEDEELEAKIEGPTVICNQLATYIAEIVNQPPVGQPGSAPFTFQWWKNSTGFFNILNGSNPPGEFLGNTQTIQLFSPPNQTFWLSVFVCGTGGVCTNSVLRVESPCEEFSGGGEYRTKSKISEFQSFSLFPNPAFDYVRLQFDLPTSGRFEYSFTNSLGQVLSNGTRDGEGIEGFDIDLPSTLSPGIYQFSLRNGSFFDVQTLFVNH